MKGFNENEWSFLNMNSPADLCANYTEDGVYLNEYNRCRDGHSLVSKFFVNSENVSFYTNIKSVEHKILSAIGLYYGDGCFNNYLLVAVGKNNISVRIPNGVPLGDTFRQDGPRRYYTVANVDLELNDEFKLGFIKDKESFVVTVDDVKVLDIQNLKLPFEAGNNAKIIVKALPEPSVSKTTSLFKDYKVLGLSEVFDFNGILIDECSKKGIKNAYVHILGEFNYWSKTDDSGRFTLKQLPLGKYKIVCGMEGGSFHTLDILHENSECFIKCSNIEIQNNKEGRENIKQLCLNNNLDFKSLNGIWNFDFDKNNVGLDEKWYIKGLHNFSKCLKVPFSWQSLMAFGEEELQDDYSLHQNNTYTSTSKEVGGIGWYQRRFVLENFKVSSLDNKTENNIALYFAGVSGVSKVWLNDVELGYTVDNFSVHSFDLGKLELNKEYTITVMVNYEHSNNWSCTGKQGFWFTDSPGVWQNVWIQSKSQVFVNDVLIDYNCVDYNNTELDIKIEMSSYGVKQLDSLLNTENKVVFSVLETGNYKATVKYYTKYETMCSVVLTNASEKNEMCGIVFDALHEGYDRKEIYFNLGDLGEHTLEFTVDNNDFKIIEIVVEKVSIDYAFEVLIDGEVVCEFTPIISSEGTLVATLKHCIKDTKLWSSSNPYLYKVEIKDVVNDAIFERTLGIRKVEASSTDEAKGRYISVNEEKVYIRGVMDQGYNPWGIYTYPKLRGNVKGSAEFDVVAAEDCGYNLVRMHIKNNENEWYNVCDERGMFVWDETTPNFYGVAEDKHCQDMFKRELKYMTKKHNYHASVIMCSVFNESWGITGDHEKSPWDNELGQKIIKENTLFYKNKSKQTLAIDNSGYAKTSETDIIDYHSYPSGYTVGKEFFEALAEQNYIGSNFNFFNSKNRDLMLDDDIRNLLQRTCSQDLKNLNFVGEEVQKMQPILLSEFVHCDRLEELIRIFGEFSGYVRMNIASQENEDTSPYTASRVKRDFGYVNEDFTKATYKLANMEDMVFLDSPFLTKVNSGDEMSVPVFVSLWDESLGEKENLNINWKLVCLDKLGRHVTTNNGKLENCFIKTKTPLEVGRLNFEIPTGYKGAYLFANLEIGGKIVSHNYVQYEIFAGNSDNCGIVNNENYLEFSLSDVINKQGFDYWDKYENNFGHNFENRELFWGYGSGIVELSLNKKTEAIEVIEDATLIMEISNCFTIEGTRETDESMKTSFIDVFVNDVFIEKIEVKALSCDKRALFSNSSASSEREIKYATTGKYGYGTRVEINIPKSILTKLSNSSIVSIKFVTDEKGIVIYGNRMGSFGTNPLILF